MPRWICPKCKTEYSYCVGDNPTCTCLQVPEIKEKDQAVEEAKKEEAKARRPKMFDKMVDKADKDGNRPTPAWDGDK